MGRLGWPFFLPSFCWKPQLLAAYPTYISKEDAESEKGATLLDDESHTKANTQILACLRLQLTSSGVQGFPVHVSTSSSSSSSSFSFVHWFGVFVADDWAEPAGVM
jgi:hypothetical protein